jgi:hypothetical protein
MLTRLLAVLGGVAVFCVTYTVFGLNLAAIGASAIVGSSRESTAELVSLVPVLAASGAGGFASARLGSTEWRPAPWIAGSIAGLLLVSGYALHGGVVPFAAALAAAAIAASVGGGIARRRFAARAAARSKHLPFPWRRIAFAGVLAAALDVAQYRAFQCSMAGWFSPLIGLGFFFPAVAGSLLIASQRRRMGAGLLGIASLFAVPWLLSHMCP